MTLRRFRPLSTGLFYLSIVAVFGSFFWHAYAGGHRPRSLSGEWEAKAFLWPVLIYLAAHSLRFIRLSVLLGANGLRKLLGLYFYTTACSTLIPFKLGELVRVNEIAWWTGSYWRGLLVVWVERVFDASVLAATMVFLIYQTDVEIAAVKALLLAIASFILVSILLLFIIPEQLISLNLHVIRSYEGKKAIRLLRLIDTFYDLLQQFKPLISGKFFTLAFLTMAIWSLELSAVALLFDQSQFTYGLATLITQFSDTITLPPSTTVQLSAVLQGFVAAKVAAVSVVGLVALLFYINTRRTLRRKT